jgi:hypothetical protein
MRILFTSTCKPIPIFLNRFLSIDDVSYRFIVDQGPFSATADVPSFSLHFLAQNIACPSTVLEWPTLEELAAELQSSHYDYVAITCKVIDMDHLQAMIPLIRRVSSTSKIILGGYGTLGLNEPQFAAIGEAVDHVCTGGDGVKFLRTLLGEPLDRGMQAHLPVEVIRIPWLSEVGSMLAGGVQAGAIRVGLRLEMRVLRHVRVHWRPDRGNYDAGRDRGVDEVVLREQSRHEACLRHGRGNPPPQE